jgi:hypothetical protein
MDDAGDYVRTYASELEVGAGLQLTDNNVAFGGQLDFGFSLDVTTSINANHRFRVIGQLNPDDANAAVWYRLNQLTFNDFQLNGAAVTSLIIIDDGDSTGQFKVDFRFPVGLAGPTTDVLFTVNLTTAMGVEFSEQTAVGLQVNLSTLGDNKVNETRSHDYIQFRDAIDTVFTPNLNVAQVDVSQDLLFFVAAGAPARVVDLGQVFYEEQARYNAAPIGNRNPFNADSTLINVPDIIDEVGATLTAASGSYDAFTPVDPGGWSLQDGPCDADDVDENPADTQTDTSATWNASDDLRDDIGDQGTEGVDVCGTVAETNTIPIPDATNGIVLSPDVNPGFNDFSEASQTGTLADIENNAAWQRLVFGNSPTAAPGFFPRVCNTGNLDAPIWVELYEEDGTEAPNSPFDLYTVTGASTNDAFNASGELQAHACWLISGGSTALLDAAGISTADQGRYNARFYGATTGVDVQGYTTPGSEGQLFIQSD